MKGPVTGRPVAIGLGGLCALLFALLPVGSLELTRSGLQSGELWRLWTGHFTHFGFEHLSYDLGTFVAVGALCERRAPTATRWLLALGAPALSWATLAASPQLESYRGLSGIDSMLFAAAGLSLILSGGALARRMGAVALAAFAAKTGFELAFGQPLFVNSNANFVVVPAAHGIGALLGAAPAIWSLRTKRAGAACALALASSGCATAHTQFAGTTPVPGYYTGTRWHLSALGGRRGNQPDRAPTWSYLETLLVAGVDLPLSLVADTLMAPFEFFDRNSEADRTDRLRWEALHGDETTYRATGEWLFPGPDRYLWFPESPQGGVPVNAEGAAFNTPLAHFHAVHTRTSGFFSATRSAWPVWISWADSEGIRRSIRADLADYSPGSRSFSQPIASAWMFAWTTTMVPLSLGGGPGGGPVPAGLGGLLGCRRPLRPVFRIGLRPEFGRRGDFGLKG